MVGCLVLNLGAVQRSTGEKDDDTPGNTEIHPFSLPEQAKPTCVSYPVKFRVGLLSPSGTYLPYLLYLLRGYRADHHVKLLILELSRQSRKAVRVMHSPLIPMMP